MSTTFLFKKREKNHGASESPSAVSVNARGHAGAAAGLPLFLRGRAAAARVQTKLAVSSTADPLEKEADAAAAQMLGGSPARVSPGAARPIARSSEAQGEGAAVEPDQVGEALSAGGQPLSASHRAYFEPLLGVPLGDVRVHTGERADASARAIDALAYTHGSDIVFRDGAYQPGTAEGRHVLAHELAHVAQQGAEPSVVQRFAPAGHRIATTASLPGSFGSAEIGEIYAANWERDFSQGAPQIADMVLAWKLVKRAALEHGADSGEFSDASEVFRAAVQRLLDADAWDALDESLGGYATYEHMDDLGYLLEPVERPGHGVGEIPPSVQNGLAYIRREMISAVYSYRAQMYNVSAGDFSGEDVMEATAPNKSVRDPLVSRDVVAKEAEDLAKQGGAGKLRVLAGGPGVFRGPAQGLGRAMHAIEDFFAHSNWLELAKEIKAKLAADPSSAIQSNPYDVASGLRTGTFERPDQVHALGHKLLAVATSMQADFPLLLRAFRRTKASTVLDRKWEVGWEVYSKLTTNSLTLTGEALDVQAAASRAGDAVRESNGWITTADIFTNKLWLTLLRDKAIRLIERGGHESPETGHGKIAKDQPEPTGGGVPEKDYAGALLLATLANAMIIAPLARAMQEPDEAAARAIVEEQLRILDAIITVPHRDHPFLSAL